MRRSSTLVVCAVVLSSVVLAPGASRATDDPAYDLTSWIHVHGRGLDQLNNLDYQTKMLPIYGAAATTAPGWERPYFTDPYVASEGPARADWRDVRFRNRYGAILRGTLIAPHVPYMDPITRKPVRVLPGVVIEPGGNGPYYPYMNLAQSIAESGYVVLIFRAQGDHDQDSVDAYNPAPPDPIPSTSQNEYCRPYNFEDWQQGEGGVRELGPCAGEDGPSPAGPGLADLAKLAVNDDSRGFANSPDLAAGYRATRARKAFGVLDAVRWLISDQDPFRNRVDASHIGAAGHSLGAAGVLIAGQIDTHRDIDAVVSWDNFGPLDSIKPRVPTLFEDSEMRVIGPHHADHAPDEHPSAKVEAAFRAVHIPTAMVSLANSSHQEWNYIPYWGDVVGGLALNQDPTVAEGAPSSSDGERVALYYTLAWFDRFLKPDRVHVASADQRFFARVFDLSADRVAIGQGRYDPLTGSNVPYTIGGQAVVEHLSPMFSSRADFDGVTCADLRTGCNRP